MNTTPRSVWALVALVLGSATAVASWSAGGSFFYLVGDDWDDGLGLTGRGGYAIADEHRVEMELSYFGEDQIVDGVELSHTTVPLVFQYRFMPDFDDQWQLSVGAGLGVSFLDHEFRDGEGRRPVDDIAYTWQVTVGLGFALTPDVLVSAGYRFLQIERVEIPAESKDLGGSHLFELGASWQF